MNERENPESLWATTPRIIKGHKHEQGTNMHVKITGDGLSKDQ
jgi:hypothetical protein